MMRPNGTLAGQHNNWYYGNCTNVKPVTFKFINAEVTSYDTTANTIFAKPQPSLAAALHVS